MAFCDKCGAYMSNADKFCEECGWENPNATNVSTNVNTPIPSDIPSPNLNTNNQQNIPASRPVIKPQNPQQGRRPNVYQPKESGGFGIADFGSDSFADDFFGVNNEQATQKSEPVTISEVPVVQTETQPVLDNNTEFEVQENENKTSFEDESNDIVAPAQPQESGFVDIFGGGWNTNPQETVSPVIAESQVNNTENTNLNQSREVNTAPQNSVPQDNNWYLDPVPNDEPVSENQTNKNKKNKVKKQKTNVVKASKSRGSSGFGNNKMLPIVAVVAVVVVIGLVIYSMRGDKNPDPDSSTTTTTSSTVASTEEVSFSDLEPSIIVPTSGYQFSEASVFSITEDQLAKVPDAQKYGVVTKVEIIGKDIMLTTDNGKTITFSSSIADKESYNGKGIAVEGTVLFDVISAKNVYLYIPTVMPTENTTTTTTSTVSTTTTTKPSETNPSSSVNSTTTTTTAPEDFSVTVISASQAESLKQKWSANPTLLKGQNAYFCTVKNVKTEGNKLVIVTQNYSIYFPIEADISTVVPGDKIIVLGKTTSKGVNASQLYVIK